MNKLFPAIARIAKNIRYIDQQVDQKIDQTIDSTFAKIKDLFGSKDLKSVSSLPDLIDSEQYYLVIRQSDSLLNDSKDVSVRFSANYYKSIAYRKIAEGITIDTTNWSEEYQTQEKNRRTELLKDALDSIELAIQIAKECNDYEALYMATCNKGLSLMLDNDLSDIEEARKLFIYSLQTEDIILRKKIKEYYNIATTYLLDYFDYYHKKLWEDLRNIDADTTLSEDIKNEKRNFYSKLAEEQKFYNTYNHINRQFIFIARDISGCIDENNIIRWVFTSDCIPKCLTFPNNHPQQNTLYVAHPAKKGYYLPYDGADEVLFKEKLDEFFRLVQCLGATEISYKSIDGKEVSSKDSHSRGANAGINAKGAEVQSDVFRKSQSGKENNRTSSLNYTWNLDPKNKPYCPNDLPWLEIDDSWKLFVRQRLEGNVLSYTKRMSSFETINLSHQLALDIKASFSSMMAKVSGNYNSNDDITFSHTNNSELEITVLFRSIDDFNDNDARRVNNKDTLILSDNEKKYLDEVKMILADGEIGNREKKLLERKRDKLNISAQRADEIEKSCKAQLSDEEIEYLNTYKDLAKDGIISDTERRLLDREAYLLGISLDRVLELEKLI